MTGLYEQIKASIDTFRIWNKNMHETFMKNLLLACILLLGIKSAWAQRIVVMSDFNDSYGSTKYNKDVDRAVQRVIQLKPDIVINTGDMIAGQRTKLLKKPAIESMWKSFHQHVTNPIASAGLLMAATPGNHDASAYGKFKLERSIYQQQWLKRKPKLKFIDDEHYPLYYAFRVGKSLFVSLDATRSHALDKQQKKWLDNLLKKHGGKYSQRILFSHLPIWPFSDKNGAEALLDKELEKIVQKHDVDLYLNGHHHTYYPGYKDGVRYISQSCLGSGPRSLAGTKKNTGRNITVIDIKGDNIEINAYGAPGFTQAIDQKSLPKSIKSKWAKIIREDLAPHSN
jgi:3',5'-cyclic AMP phosphodiesterase CpdA